MWCIAIVDNPGLRREVDRFRVERTGLIIGDDEFNGSHQWSGCWPSLLDLGRGLAACRRPPSRIDQVPETLAA
ncbi:hypothetical protein TA3x_000657 [Tundrisphaera sp. TA3]|uniref:hypothetical protein n=1 Tax=Tundrisphaera sp. TA3 TaxID=3435775 RepID=UPI003EBB6B3B